LSQWLSLRASSRIADWWSGSSERVMARSSDPRTINVPRHKHREMTVV
jgi:hypothetical protein